MDDYGLDIDEVIRVIDSAEVLVIRFAILEKRLLIDTRYTEFDGPVISVVNRVTSVEERFKDLKKLRPRLPLPEKIMSFMWPRQMATFRASGLWERIQSRLVSLGGERMQERCEKVFEELSRRERAEVLAAIRGSDDYQSLWERSN